MKDNLIEEDFDNFLEKLKAKNSNFDLMVEYGKLLMKNIEEFTPEEKERSKELKILLKEVK